MPPSRDGFRPSEASRFILPNFQRDHHGLQWLLVDAGAHVGDGSKSVADAQRFTRIDEKR